MKVKKILKNKKLPAVLASGVLITGLLGGAYYFSGKQDPETTDATTTKELDTTTDSQIEQDIEQKSGATAGETTTTPSVLVENPNTTSLADVSFTVLYDKDAAEAIVTFNGPAGTYGVEKLVNGSWSMLIEMFDYSGRGGRNIDTIASSASESHYRIFSIVNGARSATSGDTVVIWQEILNNGTLTVPVAR